MIFEKSLALLTDLYQLTMCYGYFQSDRHNMQSVFHLFFRENPFKGNYAVACGLQYAINVMKRFYFTIDDINYLRTLKGADGKPLFADELFFDYLAQMRFECDVDAVEEGRIVFPHTPLLRIKGPLIQCQLLESILLNVINFQSLIATKASRIRTAIGDDPLLEFGLRRAQGIDGALTATRASYIGGCDGTSNVLSGKLLGIPTRGTHAHSWVMSFDSELESFETYAQAMPNNCIFLVDTYNTLEGVDNAIKTATKMRERGHDVLGIRLDSGDLLQLSRAAREKLDAAGFKQAKIVASNDLDEYRIRELKNAGAPIDVWGVGTRLVTGGEQAALGGVYKLSGIRSNRKAPWNFKVKKSEDAIKVSNPGILQTKRFYDLQGRPLCDALHNTQDRHEGHTHKLITYDGQNRFQYPEKEVTCEDLLVPIFKRGNLVYTTPTLAASKEKLETDRERFIDQLQLDSTEHRYPLCLESKLFKLKQELLGN